MVNYNKSKEATIKQTVNSVCIFMVMMSVTAAAVVFFGHEPKEILTIAAIEGTVGLIGYFFTK